MKRTEKKNSAETETSENTMKNTPAAPASGPAPEKPVTEEVKTQEKRPGVTGAAAPEANKSEAGHNTAAPAAFSQEEVDRLVNEAYLRGKNEAIEARILADSATVLPDFDDEDTDLASVFSFRESVWK